MHFVPLNFQNRIKYYKHPQIYRFCLSFWVSCIVKWEAFLSRNLTVSWFTATILDVPISLSIFGSRTFNIDFSFSVRKLAHRLHAYLPVMYLQTPSKTSAFVLITRPASMSEKNQKSSTRLTQSCTSVQTDRLQTRCAIFNKRRYCDGDHEFCIRCRGTAWSWNVSVVRKCKAYPHTTYGFERSYLR